MERDNFKDPLFGARTMGDALREHERQDRIFARLRGMAAPEPDLSQAIDGVPEDCPGTARFRVLTVCELSWQGQRIKMPAGREFLLGRYGDAALLNRWIRGCGLKVERIDLVSPAPGPVAVAFELPEAAPAPDPADEAADDSQAKRRGRPRKGG